MKKNLIDVVRSTNGRTFTKAQVLGLTLTAVELTNPDSPRPSQYAGSSQRFKAWFASACLLHSCISGGLISEEEARESWEMWVMNHSPSTLKKGTLNATWERARGRAHPLADHLGQSIPEKGSTEYPLGCDVIHIDPPHLFAYKNGRDINKNS